MAMAAAAQFSAAASSSQQQPSSQPLSPDTKTLDTLRRSLHTLTSTLQALHRDLSHPHGNQGAPPPWSSLQNSFSVLTHNLTALGTHIDASRDLLASAHAYPLPSFPKEHEALMEQLLRKKADVGVEEWIGRAERVADSVAGGESSNDEKQKEGTLGSRLNEEDLLSLWDWALPFAGEAAQKVPLGIDVTVEEREKEGGVDEVKKRTGIKRQLRTKSAAEEDEDEEMESDEDEDEKDKEDSGKMDVDEPAPAEQPSGKAQSKPPEIPMMPLEDILKFMITGTDVAATTAAR